MAGGGGVGMSGPQSSRHMQWCNRSQIFHRNQPVSILVDLQQIQQQLPPGYLVENTALQLNFRSRKISEKEFKLICRALGVPVCIDAAQFDSLAHRVRDWWTNLCTYQQLEGAKSQVHRSNRLKVRTVLGVGREEAECLRPDPKGRYPANECTAAIVHRVI